MGILHVNQSCRLCQEDEAIKGSHIIPAFAYRSIKEASPTGFLRNPYSPNIRRQDGDKMPLLCGKCEGRFSTAEGEFARRVFEPFSRTDVSSFDYGPWLHYFLTSLSWRTLALDIPTMGDANEMIQRAARETLEKDRRYLLGEDGLGATITHHLYLFSAPHETSPDLADVGPNVLLRCSAVGYATWLNSCGALAVIHNLAGIFCVRMILKHSDDQWKNTSIDPAGGKFAPPQEVKSWLFTVLVEGLVDNFRATPSESQRKKIIETAEKNPSAPSLRFYRADEELRRKCGR